MIHKNNTVSLDNERITNLKFQVVKLIANGDLPKSFDISDNLLNKIKKVALENEQLFFIKTLVQLYKNDEWLIRMEYMMEHAEYNFYRHWFKAVANKNFDSLYDDVIESLKRLKEDTHRAEHITIYNHRYRGSIMGQPLNKLIKQREEKLEWYKIAYDKPYDPVSRPKASWQSSYTAGHGGLFNKVEIELYELEIKKWEYKNKIITVNNHPEKQFVENSSSVVLKDEKYIVEDKLSKLRMVYYEEYKKNLSDYNFILNYYETYYKLIEREIKDREKVFSEGLNYLLQIDEKLSKISNHLYSSRRLQLKKNDNWLFKNLRNIKYSDVNDLLFIVADMLWEFAITNITENFLFFENEKKVLNKKWSNNGWEIGSGNISTWEALDYFAQQTKFYLRQEYATNEKVLVCDDGNETFYTFKHPIEKDWFLNRRKYWEELIKSFYSLFVGYYPEHREIWKKKFSFNK